jgi:hypothetical protein
MQIHSVAIFARVCDSRMPVRLCGLRLCVGLHEFRWCTFLCDIVGVRKFCRQCLPCCLPSCLPAYPQAMVPEAQISKPSHHAASAAPAPAPRSTAVSSSGAAASATEGGGRDSWWGPGLVHVWRGRLFVTSSVAQTSPVASR